MSWCQNGLARQQFDAIELVLDALEQALYESKPERDDALDSS
jgi:hypothetical protein